MVELYIVDGDTGRLEPALDMFATVVDEPDEDECESEGISSVDISVILGLRTGSVSKVDGNKGSETVNSPLRDSGFLTENVCCVLLST